MNIIKLTLLLLGFSSSLLAQNKKISIGLSASVDFNTYIGVGNRWAAEYAPRLNYSAGPVIKYYINERLSVNSGVLFSTKNIKERIDLDAFAALDPFDQVLRRPTDSDNLLLHSYLDIPVSLNYRIRDRDKIEMIVSLGLVNSFQISNKKKSDEDLSIQIAEYNKYLLSSKIGWGLLMKRESFNLYIEPQARFYLSSVHARFPNKNPIHFGIEFQLIKI